LNEFNIGKERLC